MIAVTGWWRKKAKKEEAQGAGIGSTKMFFEIYRKRPVKRRASNGDDVFNSGRWWVVCGAAEQTVEICRLPGTRLRVHHGSRLDRILAGDD